ncbi:ataxin-3 [Puma concolor]|uniref:ubiquitinyl hydrolase 1 n=1 Tax=Puma concolor TaxID=9696 RepID=A0A6P6HHI5_PUMCO|nr:ataxin-3 [Puma concolor]
MESIFHEKQEGSLCAQHCLNNLLQGEYFSPVELSSIAHQLDEEERMRMAEGGVTSEDYRTFLQQPSGNMDDSGFFSIQVISNALKVWGLELILFNSPEYQRLGIDPINERSFICNYKEHWFTVRKLGKQWFNLNSLLTGPELISDTYLALFLAQLQQEGSSRNVSQDIPQTSGTHLTSEELRKRREAYFEKQQQQQHPPAQLSHPRERPTTSSGALGSDPGDAMSEEDMLQAAVTMSLEVVRNNFKTEGKK